MSQPPEHYPATQPPAPPPPPDEPHQHGEHGDHHAHPPYQAHHFDTMVQQVDAGKLGMWTFLATEILMFGGLFCAYGVWRSNNFEAFNIGYVYLDTFLGAFNTVVLLASSFTMAWAVRAIQLNQQKLCFLLMGLTFLGGTGFMVVKYFEYEEKFAAGMGPGLLYTAPQDAAAELAAAGLLADAAAAEAAEGEDAEADQPPAPEPARAQLGAAEIIDPSEAAARAALPAVDVEEFPEGYYWYHTPAELMTARPFFSIYFLMTGLHGIHVLLGMGLIGWVMLRVKQGEFNTEYNAPVDLVGLYWHLVDLVWIFLFPLLYLIR